MSKEEQLLGLIKKYDVTKSIDDLEIIKKFPNKETLYFKEYYSDSEGKAKAILPTHRDSGKFIDFTISSNFHHLLF